MCPFSVRFADPAVEPGYAARGPGERPVGVEPLSGKDGSEVRAAAPTDSAESRGPADARPGPGPIHPGTDGPPLVELLRTALSEEAWDAFSRGSAIRRAGRAGFARNVCVAMGNWLGGEKEAPAEAVAVLVDALFDPEPLVRGHAAWALARVASPSATEALSRASASEEDSFAREELAVARRP